MGMLILIVTAISSTLPRKSECFMPAVQIQQRLWNALVVAAEKQRRRPETLANHALRDFLQRTADEELLAGSGRAAHRAPFPAADTEEVIRRYLRKKRASRC
jgi:hypothetical protein